MFSQFKVYGILPVPEGKILPVPVEQFASKSFFDNDCGWTRNDIAVLAATTSKAQYDAIVQRLVERKAEFNLKPDVKLVDAFKQITPSWCQSPLELQGFAEYVGNMSLEDLEKAYEPVKEKPVEPSPVEPVSE